MNNGGQTAVKSRDPSEVINMSKKSLTKDQLSLLNKGLNFVPTQKTPLTLLLAELQEWQRLMRLREFWDDDDDALKKDENERKDHELKDDTRYT